MFKIVIICVCFIMLVLFFLLKRDDYKLFNKHYYAYVYNFDYELFDSLDDQGKFEYYELLKIILTIIEPTKEKNSTINSQINRTSEIISYIEKKYPEIIKLDNDE